MRRIWWLEALALVGLLVVILVFFHFRGRATPVPVSEILARYRAQAPVSTTPAEAEEPTSATGLPAAGVYVYTTSGWESIGLIGGRHRYPSRTTLTVAQAPCGVTERWDVLIERWEEATICATSPRPTIDRFTSYHEFLTRRDRRTFLCEAGTPSIPPIDVPGQTWTLSCASGDTQTSSIGTLLGDETLTIEGRPVAVAHVRVESRLTGEIQGTRRAEFWISRRTGLLLRAIVGVEGKGPAPVGTLDYTEHYELNLTSLDPIR